MSETAPTTPDAPLPKPARYRGWYLTKILVLELIVFVCGGATGWGLRMYMRPPLPFGSQFVPEPPVAVMVDQLQHELLLNDDQTKQVRQIYQERNDALHAIREKMGPELKAEYDKLSDQMKKVLNPEQFQRWNERFETVRNRMLPPPPDRNGPPDGGGPMGFGGGGPGMGPPPGPGGPFGGGPPGGGPFGGGPPGSGPSRGPGGPGGLPQP